MPVAEKTEEVAEVVQEEPGVDLRVIDREEFELPAAAYGAEVKHDKDDIPVEVKFIPKRRIVFAQPGRRVGAKRLYTVKAEKPDGTVVQIPLEGQINNQVASPENFLGLRFYEKKGFTIFFDYETGRGLFCPSWDCWAQWNDSFGGFCCAAHREITSPEDNAGAFGDGATTSASVWRT